MSFAIFWLGVGVGFLFAALGGILLLVVTDAPRPRPARGSFEGSMARWGALMERLGRHG